MCKDISANMPTDFFYFNSGVIVIDLDRWRKRNIEEKLFVFIRNNPDKLWVADQDPLNVILIGECVPLAQKYNFTPALTNPHREKDPIIVHFSGGTKPWYLLSALPHREDYIKYANMTPWKNEKYRKFMDTLFAQKYHFYPIVWRIWNLYKKIKKFFRGKV